MLELYDVTDLAECEADCYVNPECTWWSYFVTMGRCLSLSDCVTIDDETYNNVVSGEKKCYDGLEERVREGGSTGAGVGLVSLLFYLLFNIKTSSSEVSATQTPPMCCLLRFFGLRNFFVFRPSTRNLE